MQGYLVSYVYAGGFGRIFMATDVAVTQHTIEKWEELIIKKTDLGNVCIVNFLELSGEVKSSEETS